MGLTDREAALELRGRYIRLLAELRRTRDHNPETLDAFERILQPEALNPTAVRAMAAGAGTLEDAPATTERRLVALTGEHQ